MRLPEETEEHRDAVKTDSSDDNFRDNIEDFRNDAKDSRDAHRDSRDDIEDSRESFKGLKLPTYRLLLDDSCMQSALIDNVVGYMCLSVVESTLTVYATHWEISPEERSLLLSC